MGPDGMGWLLTLSPTSCVLLEKSPDLSALQFLHSVITLRLFPFEAAYRVKQGCARQIADVQ